MLVSARPSQPSLMFASKAEKGLFYPFVNYECNKLNILTLCLDFDRCCRAVFEHRPQHPNIKGLSTGRKKKNQQPAFYHGNLPSFRGNAVILCYKTILPWKLPWIGSKIPRYFNPRKSRVKITVVIYHDIVL